MQFTSLLGIKSSRGQRTGLEAQGNKLVRQLPHRSQNHCPPQWFGRKLGTPDTAAVNSFLQFQRHHTMQESAGLFLNTSYITLPFSYKELQYPAPNYQVPALDIQGLHFKSKLSVFQIYTP